MTSNTRNLPEHKRKPYIGKQDSYTPDIAEKLFDYFFNFKPNPETGQVFPTFEYFFAHEKLKKQTVALWLKKHEDLAEVHALCKQLQQHMLMNGGLNGNYNAKMTAVILQNQHDWMMRREEQNIIHSEGNSATMLAQKIHAILNHLPAEEEMKVIEHEPAGD